MKGRDYLKLYGYFVKNNIIAQMAYRSNFIISILTEVGFIFAKSLYIIVLFSAGLSIRGLEPKQMLLFIGSYTLITGIMDAVCYPNIAAIPEYIRTASLDLMLTKPVNSLFISAFRKFDLGLGIPNVAGGLAMIAVSWKLSGIPFTAYHVLGFVFFIVLGCILTFPILMIPVTCSFWMIKSSALMDVIWAMWDFNNMPMTIYNRIIKAIGIFVLPVFMVTNLGPMFLLGILPRIYMVYAMTAIPVFLKLSITFWNFAIKRYSSAGG
ncbi:ABC-2 family transporter protein [Hungatella sp.]|uniref:ABC transporter permease n=1 Tax=Hungatella sp. TaxID=2613924 RepID=UPI002A81B0C7|nr:ABC-2 family transporter protein [Hungatella sp.]